MPLPTIVITRGPAIVTFNSVTYYTQSPIKATIDWALFDVSSDQFGVVSRRVKSRIAKIAFTPAGAISTGLWPYAATALGANIMPGSQLDLVIIPLTSGQKKWTFYGCAITKAPPLFCSTTKTLWGEVEFTALGKYATSPDTADSLCLRESHVFSDTSFTAASILTQPYTCTLGATGIETKDGVELDINWGLTPIESDTYGIVGFALDSVSAVAKFTPRSLSEDALVAMFNGGALAAAIGGAVDTGANLVVAGTGVTATIYNCRIENLQPTWGLKEDRIGQIELVALRKITTGASTAMYALA